MKGKSELVFGGGGDAIQSGAVEEYFFAQAAKNAKGVILCVPAAQPVEAYADCEAWFKRRIAAHCKQTVMVLKDLQDSPPFDHVAAIYIGGGDTNRLLNALKAASFEVYLQHCWREGVPIFGGSAGAILFGQYIWTAPEARPAVDRGLNWLDGICIGAHYADRDDADYLAFTSERPDAPILAIPEDGGLVFGEQTVQVLGKAPVAKFHHGVKQIMAPGIYDKVKLGAENEKCGAVN
jgi:dipeptidase E